jgi:hypothetical protein
VREFRVFGLRRSGNHAVIEWIARHFEHVEHFNDVWGWDEFTFGRRVEYGDVSRPIDCRILSYEDFEPSSEEAADPRCILLLRDFYNVAASRLESGRGIDSSRERHTKPFCRSSMEVWCHYADLFDAHRERFILFNEWAVSSDYRESLERRLHLGSAQHVSTLPASTIGKGSSFGDSTIDPRTINRRYLMLPYTFRAEWKRIVEDERVVSYCKTIFSIEPNVAFDPGTTAQVVRFRATRLRAQCAELITTLAQAVARRVGLRRD